MWNVCSWATRESCKQFLRPPGSAFAPAPAFPMKLSGKKSRQRMPTESRSETVPEKTAGPTADVDRGRHFGPPGFNVYAGGPGNLASAERPDWGCITKATDFTAGVLERLAQVRDRCPELRFGQVFLRSGCWRRTK